VESFIDNIHDQQIHYSIPCRGRRGCDLMVVAFVQSVPITTKVVSSNPVHGEVYSIQHYVIKTRDGLVVFSSFLHQ